MAITLARVVKISGKETIKIEIPADFLETTLSKDKSDSFTFGNCVIIYTPSTKIIKVYPTKSDTVARVEIEIGELTPDFLQEISAIFLEAGIKTLYSTGVCFTSESCLYEVYVDKSDFPESFDFKSRASEIRGVANVKIDMLKSDE